MTSRSALSSISNNTERSLDAKSRRQTMAAVPFDTNNNDSRKQESKRKSLGGGAQRRHSVGRKSIGRMSLSGARMSMGGNGALTRAGRRSSVMPNGRKSIASSKQHDPRPLSDRAYMVSSIKTLIRFLSEHEYDRQLSTKLLTSPTSKDFQCIVEFLFRQIDSNFVMDKKFEETIPAIFKQLGYPYQISKTSLYAVGSPHTWPSLLGALTWLVELLTYQEIVEERETEAADALEEDNPEKLFFNYLSTAYGTFMSGDDADIDKLDQSLEKDFRERDHVLEQQVAVLNKDVNNLKHTLQQIEDDPNSLSNLSEKRSTLTSDRQKFLSLLSELEAHSVAVTQRHQQHIDELQAVETECTSTRSTIEELNQRLAKQELRPADVERLQSELNALERTVKALLDARAGVEADAQQKAAAIDNARAEVDAALAAYHEEARRLALIPSNAANAHGRSFQIAHASSTDSDAPLLETNVRESIIPQLEATLKEMRDAVQKDHQKLLELAAKRDSAAELRADKAADINRLRRRLEKSEATYALDKQRAESELRSIEQEIEQIQSEIENAKSATADGLERASQAVLARQQRYAALLTQCNEEKIALASVVSQMCAVLTQHKEFVGSVLEETLVYVEETLQAELA